MQQLQHLQGLLPITYLSQQGIGQWNCLQTGVLACGLLHTVQCIATHALNARLVQTCSLRPQRECVHQRHTDWMHAYLLHYMQ